MDPELYRAVTDDKCDVLLRKKDQFKVQLTPNKNTVLHIAAQFGKTECVKEILKNCLSLIFEVNNKGETALHMATKGDGAVVVALIEGARECNGDLESGVLVVKKMLRVTNEDGDTALHNAVRKGNLDVVKMLVEEDPDFEHPCNKDGETPLYLAAEKKLEECVAQILETCTSPSPRGPGGRTALHAAIIFNSEGCTSKVLKWKQDLTLEADLHGWLPLHYAAHLDHVERVEQLLVLDPSIAYITAKEDDNKTALHVAASRGKTSAMKALMAHCPDCWEMVDGKGQNILHIAVESWEYSTISLIMELPFLASLVNQKDNNGNTPIHLMASSFLFMDKLITHPTVDMMTFNKESLTPGDVSRESLETAGKEAYAKLGAMGQRNMISRDKIEKAEIKNGFSEHINAGVEDLKKSADTKLLVAALITTVTFAAAFTLPGGYNGSDGENKGMAVLARTAAFKIFLITDTIAMICSSLAVFFYFLAAGFNQKFLLIYPLRKSRYLVMIANVAMMLAFATGLFAVLQHSTGLAISICVMVSFSLIISYFVKRYMPSTRT